MEHRDDFIKRKYIEKSQLFLENIKNEIIGFYSQNDLDEFYKYNFDSFYTSKNPLEFLKKCFEMNETKLFKNNLELNHNFPKGYRSEICPNIEFPNYSEIKHLDYPLTRKPKGMREELMFSGGNVYDKKKFKKLFLDFGKLIKNDFTFDKKKSDNYWFRYTKKISEEHSMSIKFDMSRFFGNLTNNYIVLPFYYIEVFPTEFDKVFDVLDYENSEKIFMNLCPIGYLCYYRDNSLGLDYQNINETDLKNILFCWFKNRLKLLSFLANAHSELILETLEE
ncbi:hypothetical protein KMW28_08505 [Flammeovirga yaeyamensis]|uniref:Uncharacterized protein n=1 Tax=Flammeovirga yaeyamensis TaxID=367791 RepID=A0AAX1ND63_9BACT|nr:hypothetical protein [Flammeovirga yaeyamensis]MBB3698998.1 hypothetical protein [Flammeovirga yaeyamensis]NMF36432.1 hypothetical protein [Flammeovirga yaeyamensis]QWG03608.1 hypothetical protein KMW28_08505 [Flammeovirga yaeyamensis]